MTRPADLLLHPVRLRVVQALLGHEARTTADLRQDLGDVPPATLYRHLRALIDGGVVRVVSERQVRGAVERRYALVPEAAALGPDDVASMSPEDHRRGFQTFLAGLLGDFERYLAGGDVDLVRDRIGYQQLALHLTDEELDELATEIGEALRRRREHGPGPGRRRRVLSTVSMTDPHV